MRVLLICPGSAGNALPFVGLGANLAKRGHEAVLFGDTYLGKTAKDLNLKWSPLLESSSLKKNGTWSASPYHLANQLKVLNKTAIHSVYDAIEKFYIPNRTIAVAQGWLFGARIAQEKLGIPLATVHLQPLMFGRLHEPDYLPGLPGFWLRWMRQFAFRKLAQSMLGRNINLFRDKLGLKPTNDILKSWWRSPQLVLAMFPSWFSEPRKDWPSQTAITGFPLFDELGTSYEKEKIDQFLTENDPPVVFTQPSLLKTDVNFFKAAAEISKNLKRRVILLSLKAESPPDELPDNFAYFGFVPLSRILPKAAAIVHHGGIGTIAQAIAAGIPQLTIPRFLDQHDNSKRLLQLGISHNIPIRRAGSVSVTRAIEGLISSESIKETCRHYARCSLRENGIETGCDKLEMLAKENKVS